MEGFKMDDWGMNTGTMDGGFGQPAGGGFGAPQGGGFGPQGGGGGYAPRPTSQRLFHLPLLLWALVGAAVGLIIGCLLFEMLYDSTGSNVLLVGLVLGIIAGCVLLACGICEMTHPRLTVGHELTGARLLLALAGGLAVLVLGCVCEFLYELNGTLGPASYNDYIFVIDDSSSMLNTDPQDLRYSALEQFLASMGEDKRVGLVHFRDDIYIPPVELAPMDDTQRQILSQDIAQHVSDGQTDIALALDTALELYQRNRQPGRAAVVVLLSDGGSDVRVSEVARRYLDAGVTINSAALSDGAREDLLRALAEETGGQFFKVEQAGDLMTSFQRISTSMSQRCLFTPRPPAQRTNIVYLLLRILFLTLPGLLIGLFLLLLLQESPANLQLLVSALAGLGAALVMEFGTLLSLPLTLVHVISWLLYGLVIMHYVDKRSGVYQTGMEARTFDNISDSAFNDFMARDRDRMSRREEQAGRQINRGGGSNSGAGSNNNNNNSGGWNGGDWNGGSGGNGGWGGGF